MPKTLYNKKEVAKLLGIGKSRLNHMIKDGELESVGGLVPVAAIERIIGHPLDGPAVGEAEEKDPELATLEKQAEKLEAQERIVKAETKLAEAKDERNRPGALKKREDDVEQREQKLNEQTASLQQYDEQMRAVLSTKAEAGNMRDEASKVLKNAVAEAKKLKQFLGELHDKCLDYVEFQPGGIYSRIKEYYALAEEIGKMWDKFDKYIKRVGDKELVMVIEGESEVIEEQESAEDE